MFKITIDPKVTTFQKLLNKLPTREAQPGKYMKRNSHGRKYVQKLKKISNNREKLRRKIF